MPLKMMETTMIFQANYNVNPSKPSNEARRKGDVIHSGHFMVSSVADDQDENEEIDHNRDSPVHHEQSIMIKHGYDFSNVPKETKDTYQFGPSNQITIDGSLSRLFKCMSLAYHGGKVVSPKWKNFKGLKLTVKDKIRLNNAIWRTWHIQYVMRKRKEQSLIQFATPLDNDHHSHARPEAVVMEGKYWKRRIETVVAEYKKWRAFFMNKLHWSGYPRLTWATNSGQQSPSKQPEYEKKGMDDQTFTDFTDTLFNSLSQQAFQFPNPREIAMHATNSDLMQSGLLQLQPVMDDYMEFDPLQELLNPTKKAYPGLPGNGQQTFSQTNNDIFAPNDFAFTMEHNSLSQANNIATTQKAMDFINSYPDVSTQAEYSRLTEPVTSADPIFSAVNLTTVPYTYSTQTLQPQTQTINQMQLESTDMAAINPPYNIQQKPFVPEQMPKHLQENDMANVLYLPDANKVNVQVQRNPTHLAVYPHSKLSRNSNSDRIIYTKPQVSVPVEFLPNNHGQVVVQADNNRLLQIASLQTNAYDMNATAIVRGDGRTAVEMAQNPQDSQQVFAKNANMTPTTSNVILLRQLLTNKTPAGKPTTVTARSHAKPVDAVRQSNVIRLKSGQPLQVSVLDTQTQVAAQVTHQKSHSSVHASPTQHTPPLMPDVVTEKLAEEARLASVPPWPLVPNSSNDKNTQSASFKPVVDNMEMDHDSASLAQPATPESSDAAQLEMLQRSGSFSAEQKRRFNIKMGFSRLQKLLPGGNSQTTAKLSKATLMNKAAQHIKLLQTERTKVAEELQSLKQDLKNLNLAISNCQQQLPATGAPIARPRIEEGKSNFKNWIRQRTKQDWKFNLFGVVIQPWFDSYQRTVSVASSQELCQTVFDWLDQRCSLSELRPSVVRSLQVICTTTPILLNPSQVRHHIEESVRKEENELSSSRHNSAS
ncbi:unnamed protein product [Clavelina lepadiformis]|uniref:BHLH domain-containing protein n=1 Tax=Clavelina lepadiformis TaxID=159417 RepID=A0ABP0GMR1_CLALP